MSEFKFKVGDYVRCYCIFSDKYLEPHEVASCFIRYGVPHYKLRGNNNEVTGPYQEHWLRHVPELDLAHYFARKICDGERI
jgi:hypothetical protein